jgi:quercetin dioxygenase-like cupin family protein
MFEVHCAPQGRMPQPHYHRGWEETVYGLGGVTTFVVDGMERPIGRGDHLFVPRGIVHGFENRSEAPSSFLSVLTPGVLGPEYFREMAALLSAAPPDKDALRATMTKYGLVPVG